MEIAVCYVKRYMYSLDTRTKKQTNNIKRHLFENLVVSKYTNDAVIKVGSEQGETYKGIVMSRNVLNLSKQKYIIPDKRLI